VNTVDAEHVPGPAVRSVVRRRIALVSVRFTMFDEQMPATFPARMRAHGARSAELLRSRFDVIEYPLIESMDDAGRVADDLAREDVAAVVFAPAMAAPPSFADRALSGLDVPLVIWNAPSMRHLGTDLRQSEATEHTTTVGALMYANVRSREGRPVQVVTASHNDEAGVDRVMRTITALAEASALRGTTIARVGDPIAGYLDVVASPEELERLAVDETRVELPAWNALVARVSESDAAALIDDVRSRGWKGDLGPAAAVSARVAVALDRVMDELGAEAGTVNCHGPYFRDNDDVGVTACLGVVYQALAGRPIACTGDVPTAVTLLLARRLAGVALYCECYAPELDTGLALMAAGGEGDPGWAEGNDRIRLEPNTHYPGRSGPGTAISFPLRLGPATFLSMSPAHDGWVLAWATGSIAEARYPNLGGPNGMFRFDSGPVDEAISRWIASGATHHGALAPGHLDVEIPAFAQALGIRAVRC
jgi:L-arabinose isomerase